MAATKILRGYPDYGKAPPEYVATFMAALERYSLTVIAKLSDVGCGLPAKCKFLPTPADVAEWGKWFSDEASDREEREYRYANLHRRLPAPDDRTLTTLEERKAFLIGELGYDPARGRKTTTWCFDPEKPPADAPWRDPAKLVASAKRIKAEMGLVEFDPLSTDRMKGDQP